MLEDIEKKAKCLWASMSDKGKLRFARTVTKEYLSLVFKEKGIHTMDDLRRECSKPNNIFSKDKAGMPFLCRMLPPRSNDLNRFVGRVLNEWSKWLAQTYDFPKSIREYYGEAFEDFVLEKLFDASEKLYQKYADVIEKINTEIRKRTSYGVRRIPLYKIKSQFPACIMVWSNAWEMWYASGETVTYHGLLMKGITELHLDANEILVPVPCDVARKVQCFLEPLPLYSYSFEFKKRYVKPEDWYKHSEMWLEKRFEDMLRNMLEGDKNGI